LAGEKVSQYGLSGGGRTVAVPGVGIIDFASLPPGVTQEYLSLSAEDGGKSRAVLYQRGGEKTVLYFMHPRADMQKHYAMDELLRSGFATFGHNNRWLNNDIACIHETLLLDIAAGVRLLRERGYRHVVLVGNSGGGSLFGFYQAQASLPPPQRLERTPAGDPPNLNDYDLPKADGLILLAAHPGQGMVLRAGIDPAVIDEDDYMATDADLDMYAASNGFKQPPASSSYSPEFVVRYRQAQLQRVARLDAVAESRIRQQTAYMDMAAKPELEPHQTMVTRYATAIKLMTIYRTDANLAYCDLSLSPSKRVVGSLISKRPDISNFAPGGFAGVLTPRAWLSTWSGIRSNASLLRNITLVSDPTLLVNYTGDNGIYPEEAEAICAASNAKDKSLQHVDADHYGLPLTHAHDPDTRATAKSMLVEWLNARF